MTGIAFTPIRQARASGEIVSQIEHAIFEGELKRGDRLESELTQRFQQPLVHQLHAFH